MATFGELLGAEILERRENGGWTQHELAEEAFPDLDDHDGKERRIRELEAGDVKRPQAKNYMPICEVLNIDRPHIRALKAQAANAKEQEAGEFDDLQRERGTTEDILNDPSSLSRDELELLATRFGIDGAADAPDTELQRQLTFKADEYRALKSEIDGIADTYKRLSNLKAAAQDAIDKMDLEEVETILNHVHEVELEEAAKTAELRANNALLRGSVEQAYELLNAASNSYAPVDPLRPALLVIQNYNRVLKENARRFGGDGYYYSIKLIQLHLTEELKTNATLLWAEGQNTLAIALQEQGARTEGAAGADLLSQAIAAYRDALTVYIRDDHPVHWAGTQNNLGAALRNQGIRTEGAAGADLLSQAVTAYRDALTVRTRADHLVQWAESQECIAFAEQAIAQHDSTDDPAPHLRAALQAVDSALEVYDPEHLSYRHGMATRLRDAILADLDALG